MLLPLSLASVILFLLLELDVDQVHLKEFLLSLGWVLMEVFLMCHSLAEARGDTVQDDIDEMMVTHLGIDIESIDIMQVFLDSTCLFEIVDHIKSTVWHVVITMALSNGLLVFFPIIEPMLVGFPLFQCDSFCTWADISQPLYLLAGFCDGELSIHLKGPSFQVLHVASEF